jgi:hypothetical protein
MRRALPRPVRQDEKKCVVRRHEGSPNRGLDFLFLLFLLGNHTKGGAIRVGHTFVPGRREGLATRPGTPCCEGVAA